jgi:hypothetical protein
MGLSADLRDKLQLAPCYTSDPGAPRAAVAAEEFPAGLPGAAQAPVARGRQGGAPPSAAGRQKTTPAGPAGSSRSSGGGYAYSGPPNAAARATWTSAAAAGASRVQPPAAAAGGEQQWQREAAEQLRWQHPWAGSELLGSLLSAVGYDLGTAEAILADMATPAAAPSGGEDLAAPGAAAALGRPGGLSEDSSEDFSEDGWPSGDEPDSPSGQLGSSPAEAGDFVLPGAVGARVGRAAPGPATRPPPAPAEPAPTDLLRPPLAPQQPGGCASGSDGGGDGGGSTDDVYWRHRGEAQRLTRDWQRAVAKAAAAYSSGNHAKARRLAGEAQRLRGESLAAHELAASKIEADLNATGRRVPQDLQACTLIAGVPGLYP